MYRDRPHRPLLLTALLAVLAACESAGDQPAAPSDLPPAAAAAADPAGFLGLGIDRAKAASELVWIAGQPTPEQFAALPGAGIHRAVSLRLPIETGAGFEESQAAAAGVDFVRIPIAGAEDLTRDSVAKLSAALAAADGPVLVYCRSANRVGALMALRAAWEQGASVDEALAIGRAHGMSQLEADVKVLLGK
ncbi:MAG: hypothetical protein IPM29_10075 [Planctomycetes bacterium]|nr:hypothetical protein [Planctomycetota bacterium]